VGASKVSHLERHTAGLDLRYNDPQLGHLNNAIAPAVGFTASPTSSMIRRMVFGDP